MPAAANTGPAPNPSVVFAVPRGQCIEKERPGSGRRLRRLDHRPRLAQGPPHVIACGEMERCSGTQFDPDIVRVFFGHIEDYRKLIPMMMFILGAPKEKPRSRSPGVLAYVP
jgi:hypothetical protein